MTTQRTPITMHVGFGGKYVSIYSKPLAKAKESDRVCRFPRTLETENIALAMAAATKLIRVVRLEQAYEDGEDWAIEEIQDAFSAQEEFSDPHVFAGHYISTLRRDVIARCDRELAGRPEAA